jgi:putative hydrolase of the HAD superfamily
MVGNSLRSDILPVVGLGGRAVYIPYHLTWAHEQVSQPGVEGYVTLENVRLLPTWLESISASAAAPQTPPPP